MLHADSQLKLKEVEYCAELKAAPSTAASELLRDKLEHQQNCANLAYGLTFTCSRQPYRAVADGQRTIRKCSAWFTLLAASALEVLPEPDGTA
jgi:hypothetical protein